MGDIAKKKDNCETPLISAIIRAKKNCTTLSKSDFLAWKAFHHSQPLNQLDPLVQLSMDLEPPKVEGKTSLTLPAVSTDSAWNSIHGSSHETKDELILAAKGDKVGNPKSRLHHARIKHLDMLIDESK
jgi:hypothetical protein